jgi:hypothetical protein
VRLRKWYTEEVALKQEDIPHFPAVFKYNIQSHLWAILLMAPVAIIGGLKNIDAPAKGEDGPDVDDLGYHAIRVLIPGLCLTIFIYVITIIFRIKFGQDMIEERSANVHVGDSQSDVLANTGLVCALFLTIVISMVQAGPPIDGQPGRLICQYYQLFNLMALFLCFMGSMMCSMLLSYITPLDEDASFVYFKNFIDYFGEPACCILTALLLFIYATTTWVFGQYGYAIGIVCCVAMDLCLQRIILCQLYISVWRNPFVSEELRLLNVATSIGNAASLMAGGSKLRDADTPKSV